MKRFGLVVAGCCAFSCALGLALVLWAYICGGAGLQIIERAIPIAGQLVSTGSVLVALTHVVGLAIASLLCFGAGAMFCAHALAKKEI